MYIAFKHLHILTAVLSILMTGIWSLLAWKGDATGSRGMSSRAKAIYISHRAVAGLVAITGLAITFIGPWRTMIFPYVGLVVFVFHGIAATVSKRTFTKQDQTAIRRIALIAQIALILLVTYAMRVKNF